MPYEKQDWQDLPAKTTPVSAARLSHMETQYEEAVADAKTYTDDELAEALAALPVPRGTSGRKYRMVACTLRRVNSTTWEFLNDSGHTPTGVTSVSITSTYIRLTYDFTATKVLTGICTPDESFAAVSGMRVGASVGTSYMDIYVYISTNTTPSDPGALSTAGANIWVWGLFEVA